MKILLTVLFFAVTAHGALLGGDGDHHHDDHHEHHDFPLATGQEAAIASARMLEFFNAIENEEPLPADMPSFRDVPTNFQFTCDNRLPGYYADVDFGCQVYHMCREDPEHNIATFLCPNATIFHQQIFACDWWFNVDCASSPDYYYLNEDIYKDPEPQEDEIINANQRFQNFARPVRSVLVPQQVAILFPESTVNNTKASNSIGNGYLPPPPKDGYLPPAGGYLPPAGGYLPPAGGYLPPDNGYLPPKKGYLPPN